MILFFNLNIGQKLADTAFSKYKDIRIVFSGNQLFRTDTVGCKECIILLILRIRHVIVGSLGLVITSCTIVAVTFWNRSCKHLSERIVVLLLLLASKS